ncbi:hypothetical protein RFN28_33775, partial [Mesorhizobium sp. VK24D]
TVEPFEYAKDDLIRRVQQHGFVSILGRTIRLCRAFAESPSLSAPPPPTASSTPGSDIRK